jgi:hypothetical protein
MVMMKGTYSICVISLDPNRVGVLRCSFCRYGVRVGWGCHSHGLVMLRGLLLLLLDHG